MYPLSITVSALTLIEMATHAFITVSKYIKAVKEVLEKIKCFVKRDVHDQRHLAQPFAAIRLDDSRG
jgi:hypothetical protein